MQSREELLQELQALQARCSELCSELMQSSQQDDEPKFERVSHGEPYYYIYGNNMQVAVASDDSDYTSEVCYMHNNYFHTKKRAQEVADKIKFLLKLERLHDIYCPDYKPDWEKETCKDKYWVYYGTVDNKYHPDRWIRCAHRSTVYFPTREIAQKVCDILNKELEDNL